MKKILPIILLALVACSGCRSTYNLTLTNGDVLTSHGKPTYDPQQARYYYRDIHGQTNSIPASKVREIAPADMADKGGSQFLK